MGLFDYFKKKKPPQSTQNREPSPKPISVKHEYKQAAVQENKHIKARTSDDASSTSHSAWEVGQIIDGLYEIFGATAGGMGAVYFANHLKWKIPLAVKTPLPALINSSSAYQRYIKEAETWINIGMHPHIVSCFYVRDLGGIPRIFIEYVSGGTLKDLIDKKQLGDISFVLDLAVQFSMAMEYVHEQGIIHRDIKPANCMITCDGELKVTDFGIAKLGDDLSDTDDKPHFASSYEGLTMTGTGFGTPEYMAPEQFLDAKNIGKEADIYSFGVMLYEMVCGKRPFVMPSGMNSQARDYFYRNAHFNESPRPPVEINSLIPQALNRLILKCLEKDFSKRFHSFVQISAMLSDCCNEVGTPCNRIKPDVLKLKADSLNNRAVSYLDLGKNEGALEYWEQALGEDPQHQEATFNFGYYRWWQEGVPYRYALQTPMSNLARIHKDSPDFWRLLAWVHYEQGDIDALDEIQKSDHRVTDPEFLMLYNALNIRGGLWVRILKGHSKSVTFVVFSPEGSYICSKSYYDKTTRLWDVTTGNEIRCFESQVVKFSVDFKYVISGSKEKSLKLGETSTGKELMCFEGEYSDVAFSPDGRYFITGGDGIKLRDTVTGKELRRFNNDSNAPITSVIFSPDGRFVLAENNENDFNLWEALTGKAVRRFKGSSDSECAADFSPDGRYLLLGSWEYRCLWETATGKELWSIEADSEEVNSMAFSPDGRYVLSGGDDIKIWESATGKILKQFEVEYDNRINSVVFSPDGRYFISESLENLIRVWEITTGEELQWFESEREKGWNGEYYKDINSAIFSPDGKHLLTVSSNDTISIWEITTGKEIRRFDGHSDNITTVAFSPDGRYIISGSKDKSIRLYPWEALKRAQEVGIYPAISRIKTTSELLKEHKKIQLLISSATDCIKEGAFCGAYMLLRQVQADRYYEKNKDILDLILHSGIMGMGKRRSFISGWNVNILGEHSKIVSSVNFSSDGKFVISGGADNTIRLWDLARSMQINRFGSIEVRCFIGHNSNVNSVAFSPDGGSVLSGYADNSLILWETATAKEIMRFEGHSDTICSITFSPDGNYILSGGYDKTPILWDVATGQVLMRYAGHIDTVGSVTFSPDGSYILSGSWDNTIRLWDVMTGNEIRRFVGHNDPVRSVAYSSDNKYVISGSGGSSSSSDNSLRLWDAATGIEVKLFEGHELSVRSVTFSPDDSFILSGSWDRTIILWDAVTGKALKRFEDHSGSVNSVSFSPDGRYVISGSSDNTIRLWELDWEWEFP